MRGDMPGDQRAAIARFQGNKLESTIFNFAAGPHGPDSCQRLGRARPQRRIGLQAFDGEVDHCAGTHVGRPQSLGRLQCTPFGRRARHRREHDNATEGIQIGRDAVGAASVDLGRHVGSGAGPRVHFASLGHEDAEAKVGKLGLRRLRGLDQDISGLQVPVQDRGRLAVQVREAPGDVLQQLPLGERHGLTATVALVVPGLVPSRDKFAEVPAVDPLEDQAQDAALDDSNSIKQDDVGVANPPE
mmetsp:Transcript_7261/g.20650  ORF Transcript_7261/g.20650 Transcript_7261/m.20650 type:complete len:244 (+) Transcript_7261:56-787(+)